ncbi:hypothetical protein G4228_010468 [Cervus hanglu yarkandensis]|nr:hypothetical protein G4228_010468 [Cervus hanglu yarkandensis]
MEGGGGSGNKTTGGLAGFFGAGGAGYSHADLAGVPRKYQALPANISHWFLPPPHTCHVSCSLSLSLFFLAAVTSFSTSSGASINWYEPSVSLFKCGSTVSRTGAAFGAMNGLRLGLKETQNMAWSKPRNVQILNMVTRQGALWANTLGSLALLYSAFGVIIEKTRGAEDDLNTVAAGTMTGMLYKCTAPGNHHSTFYELDSLRYLMEVESCSVFLFVTGLFHLA